MFITLEDMFALYKWFKHGAEALTLKEVEQLDALFNRVGRNIRRFKLAVETGKTAVME